MEIRQDTFAFYAGVMVGVLGNFVVSCFVEAAKAIFEDAPLNILTYWAIMFIISSALFFEITKFVMRRLQTPEGVLWLFDLATGVFTFLGIVFIVYGIIF